MNFVQMGVIRSTGLAQQRRRTALLEADVFDLIVYARLNNAFITKLIVS